MVSDHCSSVADCETVKNRQWPTFSIPPIFVSSLAKKSFAPQSEDASCCCGDPSAIALSKSMRMHPSGLDKQSVAGPTIVPRVVPGPLMEESLRCVAPTSRTFQDFKRTLRERIPTAQLQQLVKPANAAAEGCRSLTVSLSCQDAKAVPSSPSNSAPVSELYIERRSKRQLAAMELLPNIDRPIWREWLPAQLEAQLGEHKF
jgi:hypothetical protein